MKKVLIISKIIITVVLIIAGLLALTYSKMNGIHLFGWNVTAEQVNAFLAASGSILFWIYVIIVVLLIWGVWKGRRKES